jgi:hypothetical protein
MVQPRGRLVTRRLFKVGFGILQVLLLGRFVLLLFAPSPNNAAVMAFLSLTQPIVDVVFRFLPVVLWDPFSGSIFDLAAIVGLVFVTALEWLMLSALAWEREPREPIPSFPSEAVLERPARDWNAARLQLAEVLRARYGGPEAIGETSRTDQSATRIPEQPQRRVRQLGRQRPLH